MYKSGVHNGLDIGVPLGTFINAPTDGNVYYVGKSPQLGYFCFFEAEDKTYHVFPHLKGEVETKEYKQGETIGIVGGTGLSFGSHIHWTILKSKPTDTAHYVSLVNTKAKVLANTIDPEVWQKEVNNLNK
jgi:murein DD-endopeptidase MepM/ murein hydrolase activator NlpD